MSGAYLHTRPLPVSAAWILASLTRASRRALDPVMPDRALITACADFRRADVVLGATPYENEQATDRAWAARQALADRIAAMRPTTEAGRRGKASVAVTLLQELQPWQRDSEFMFALAAFKAEAGA